MGKIKKWLIEFVWFFIASLGTMYVIYYCTGWEWFHIKQDQITFFVGFCIVSATDSVMPRWRVKYYWRLTSKTSFGNNYTKFFHVEKRVCVFFWRKWYATKDEKKSH